MLLRFAMIFAIAVCFFAGADFRHALEAAARRCFIYADIFMPCHDDAAAALMSDTLRLL